MLRFFDSRISCLLLFYFLSYICRFYRCYFFSRILHLYFIFYLLISTINSIHFYIRFYLVYTYSVL
nr:MAG TPA: hypothetical protein [Crassvirales sp.]